ncbi:MAG: AAA family ATPase [Caldilineaceae bacterium]|nr:AAA family ATPase [Caldilineaceae bacterium]
MNHLPALHASEASFVAIRWVGGLYVDKTGFFRHLLATMPPRFDTGAPPLLAHRHQFLARPRRFGKTLLVNMLEAWFQGLPPDHDTNPEGLTANLDGMPAGWTSPPWLWEGLEAEDLHGSHGWHPVIRLDLSRASAPTPADTRSALQAYLWQVAGLWGHRSGNWTVSDRFGPPPNQPPADMLTALIQGLREAYGRRPVVLVDEYDAPIVKHIGTDRPLESAVEELRDFFRVLKDDEGWLYGAFVTGITRFARAHLFSAANNFLDISDLPRYGALCGFTEDEVALHLAPHRDELERLEPRFRGQNMLDAWREQYNGYCFAPHPGTPRVYNPFTLIRGLEYTLENEALRAQAAAGRWPAAWSESGHPGLIVRLAADTHQALSATGGREPRPSPGLADLNRPDPILLMLETGYYTWHRSADSEPAYLDFPNREVAESWTYDILGLGELAPERDGRVLAELRTHLERGDVPGFAARLETFVFGFAHENLQGEASFRVLMQALFRLMELPAQAEHSNWGGRADHVVHVGDRVYIFEVKFNRPIHEALRQIRDRGYGREHQDTDREVIAVGLAFHRTQGNPPRLECRTDNLATLNAGERDPETAPPRE